MKEMNFEGILLIQLRRIGDVLMTTPAVRAVKKRFPEAKITFLTEPPADEIFRHNPYVHEILLHNRKWGLKDSLMFIRGLRNRQFDLVIDFFGNPRSAQIAAFSGARHRIGFNFRGRTWCYTTKVALPADKNLYAPLHKLSLLTPLGIEEKDCRIEFFCSSTDHEYAQMITEKLGIDQDDFVVALCPVSRRQYRVWQPEKFAMVGDNLIERYGAKILFMWGPGEKYFIDQIKSRMKHPDKTLADDDIPTISQVRALFEKVSLYIGVDNGLRHIAITANTPTVTVFGQSNPYNWTPPESRRHQFVDYDPGCKNSCNLARCRDYQCITKVSETEYLTKIEGLIEELELDRKGKKCLN
ncbi:MAG: glycosyltransferase family 9 protein [bacterium]|nr:glycosyltransferase family 9 protein [bacterium]